MNPLKSKALFVSVLAMNSLPALAQQNLFNIPSGDITPKNKIFYQHQFNVYPKKFESKAHFVYGLGGGWDAGLNLVGKGAYFNPAGGCFTTTTAPTERFSRYCWEHSKNSGAWANAPF